MSLGFVDLLHLHLQQRARVDVERGLPELLRVHLAQPFVALQVRPLRPAAVIASNRLTGPWIAIGTSSPLRRSDAGLGVGALQRGGVFVEPARVGRAEQRVVDDRDLLDAAHGALEQEAFALDELALPAALGLAPQGVEALGDVGRGGLRPSPDRRRSRR